MAELEVVILLLAWVATFGLLVVVPWLVVRVMVAVLTMDPEATVDRWTPPIREPASDRSDDSTTDAPADEHLATSVQSDRGARDQAAGRTPARLDRRR